MVSYDIQKHLEQLEKMAYTLERYNKILKEIGDKKMDFRTVCVDPERDIKDIESYMRELKRFTESFKRASERPALNEIDVMAIVKDALSVGRDIKTIKDLDVEVQKLIDIPSFEAAIRFCVICRLDIVRTVLYDKKWLKRNPFKAFEKKHRKGILNLIP